METIKHSTLGEAIQAVMQEISYIQKEKSPNLQYSHASEAAIVGKCHGACAKNGISIVPTNCEQVHRESYKTEKGKSMNLVVVRMSYTMIHAHSADRITIVSMGEGSDVGDKSTAKAITIAYKYALRQAFMLETGNDPDEVPSSESERKSELDTISAEDYARCSAAEAKIDQSKDLEELESVWRRIHNSKFPKPLLGLLGKKYTKKSEQFKTGAR